ncbi:uncharacterized protein N7477_000980 [Penicillium maclennaniae]|uniref:uncharacterized protein n=1 Tax=Penicillium maclennaniae TaxID=1343394 RepID=UPI0025422054|nr:uncharacterized protein N7477_000980 [Penicillium maclennaniae]KAJ5684635.1 hypothetical protein N7477_000980 [Penicillium maclennaniae]
MLVNITDSHNGVPYCWLVEENSGDNAGSKRALQRAGDDGAHNLAKVFQTTQLASVGFWD